jgi:hypothetical protein
MTWYKRLLHIIKRDWDANRQVLSKAIYQKACPLGTWQRRAQPTCSNPTWDHCDSKWHFSWDTYNGKRKYRKYVFTTAHQQNLWYEPLTFTLENRKRVTHLHEDALAISIVLTNHQVHRVLVDDESLVNILYKDEMSYTRIDPSKMTHVKKLFKWD